MDQPSDSVRAGTTLAPNSRQQRMALPGTISVGTSIGSQEHSQTQRAFDQRTQEALALKTLGKLDPQQLHRLNQDLALLREHPHPHVVSTQTLYFETGKWCVVRPYLEDAVSFSDWVRQTVPARQAPEQASSTSPARALADPQTTPKPTTTAAGSEDTAPGTDDEAEPGALPPIPYDEARLRSTLAQCVEGLLHLHALGVLHRNLHPHNVLVTQDGQVHLVDSGLAQDLSLLPQTPHINPAYLSPEQAKDGQLSMASDWYSVGAMLFEALTGHLPFGGTRHDMLRARLVRDPRSPTHYFPQIPQDLANLCMSLLARDPLERPSGFEICALVGLPPSLAKSPRHVAGGAFVGRTAELESLMQAFSDSQSGTPLIAHVYGESGLGKTTLVRRFASQLSMSNQAVVLEGRCLEREAVPFQAFDELLESLCRHLARLPELEAAGLMPRDVRSLVRIFPALGRLHFLKDLGARPATADPHELRRRAFTALREIFARLTDISPVVLILDDVQWGDSDSLELLRSLLSPPEAPSLLLICCYRSSAEKDAPRDNPVSQCLRELATRTGALRTLEIPLRPLPTEAAEQLAWTLLPEALRTHERARIIAQESARSPLFIAELVRASRTKRSRGPEISIKRVVHQRVEALGSGEQEVLCALAASERGLDVTQLAQLNQLAIGDLELILDRLREEQLVVVSPTASQERYSILHDKVRRAIIDTAPPERLRRYHSGLAELLESVGADPETIAHHYLEAGNRESGLRFIEAAGDAANKRSAFNQAQACFETALTLSGQATRGRVLRKLALAMGRTGHGMAAAQMHLALCELGEDDAEEQRSRAGAQYMLSGHTDEALVTLRPLLAQHDLQVPRASLLAALSLLWRRRRIDRMAERTIHDSAPANQVDATTLRGVDLAWTLANGFAGIDVFLSVHYNALTLERALSARDPERIARALSLECILRTLEGTGGQRQAERLLPRATYFAEQAASAHARGWVVGARAIMALHRNDMKHCEELCRDALELLRESTELSFREIGTLSVWFWLYPTFLLGKLPQLAEHAQSIAREAEARGDLYTLSTTRTYVLPLHWAVQDRVEQARAETSSGLEPWAQGPWLNQHWAHLHSSCFLDLYEGKGEAIAERTAAARPRMKDALQLMVQAIRIDLLYLEGRGLLDTALFGRRPSAGRKRLLKQVQRIVRLIQKEEHGLSEPYGLTLAAGLSAARNESRALALFRSLEKHFMDRGMVLHAASAHARIEQLEALAQGAAPPSPQESDGLRRLRELGAVDAVRLSWMLIPRLSSEAQLPLALPSAG